MRRRVKGRNVSERPTMTGYVVVLGKGGEGGRGRSGDHSAGEGDKGGVRGRKEKGDCDSARGGARQTLGKKGQRGPLVIAGTPSPRGQYGSCQVPPLTPPPDFEEERSNSVNFRHRTAAALLSLPSTTLRPARVARTHLQHTTPPHHASPHSCKLPNPHPVKLAASSRNTSTSSHNTAETPVHSSEVAYALSACSRTSPAR